MEAWKQSALAMVSRLVGVEFNKLYLGINYGTDLNKFIDIDETVYSYGDYYSYKVSSKTSTFTAKVGFNF